MDACRKNLKQRVFKLQGLSLNRCFEPTETCTKSAIRAHSIQNSRTLEQLSHGGHVIMPKMQFKDGKPEIIFKSVGRNEATTFTGLCSEHDRRIFEPIDKSPINVQDDEHLFLLAYRSVLREVHGVATVAVRNQLGYQEKVRLALIPGEVPTRDGLSAVAFLANAYESYLYKRKFDAVYTASDHGAVQHLAFFEQGYEPTIAVSALFSLDEIQVDDDVARIALNVFPTATGVSVVFSFLSNESPHILPFLKPFRSSSGEALLELLSVRILLSCENFVLSPRFWNSLDPARRQTIAKVFSATVFKEIQVAPDPDLMLFRRTS